MSRSSNESSSLDSVLSVVLPPLSTCGPPSSQDWEPKGVLIEFLACLAATTVLAVGLLVLVLGLWTLPTKQPLLQITGFWRLSLCAGLMLLGGLLAICLATLACLSQHGEGFWFVTIVLTAVALMTLLVGEWQGMELKGSLVFGDKGNQTLNDGPTRDSLNSTMWASLRKYVKDSASRGSWDSLQTQPFAVKLNFPEGTDQTFSEMDVTFRKVSPGKHDIKKLQCCGVLGPEDWVSIHALVPSSCCAEHLARYACKVNTSFDHGCLDAAAIDVSFTINSIFGFNAVASSILVMVLGLASWRYFVESKKRDVTT